MRTHRIHRFPASPGRRSATALLGGLLLAAAAAAQDEEPKRYTVEEVVVEATRLSVPDDNRVATRLRLSNRETPASVSVAGAATLERQGASVLGDALRHIAGAQVHTGFGVFDYFLLRGFDSLTSGLVLIDGAPEPEATFYDLYNVARVEVLKGPAAFLYGGNPLAGVVNLVPERPGARGAQRLTASYGSFGTARLGADLHHARPERGWSGRLNAMWAASDGYRDGRGSRSLAFHPAVEWRPGDDFRVRASAEVVDLDFEPDAGLPVGGAGLAEVPRRRSYQSPFDGSRQRIYRLRLEALRGLGSGTTLRHRLYLTSLEWPSSGTLLTGLVPGAAGVEVSRLLQSLDDEQLFLGSQLELSGDGRLLGRDHTWLTGLELARRSDTFTLEVLPLPGIDLLAPVETAAEPLFAVQTQSGDARSLLAGWYAVDRIALGPRLRLFAGGRADLVDYRDEATGTDRGYRQLSPMLGLLFEPARSASLYASAGRAFAPPSSLVVGDRDAEVSGQLEAGVKAETAGGRASLSLAAYRLTRDNIAIPDPTGVTRQQGAQRSRGLEVELRARPGPGGLALLTYAWTDAELTEFREQAVTGLSDTGQPVFGVLDRSGNRPPFAPRHVLTLWATRDFTNGLGLAAGARWLGEQYIAADNAYRLDSALTFEAGLFRRVAGGRLRLHLKNLTNAEYETRGFGASSVIPADPFSAQAVLDWWL